MKSLLTSLINNLINKNIMKNNLVKNNLDKKLSRYFFNILNFIISITFILIVTHYSTFVKVLDTFINDKLDNSYILVYGIMGIYIMISAIIYKYNNISGILLFIILMIIIRIYFKSITFIERFETDLSSEQEISSNKETPITYNDEVVNTAKRYLQEQVNENPNITDLEKNVINDIYDTYFLNSNNLENLKRFNESASEYNPINNEQKVEDILNYYQ